MVLLLRSVLLMDIGYCPKSGSASAQSLLINIAYYPQSPTMTEVFKMADRANDDSLAFGEMEAALVASTSVDTRSCNCKGVCARKCKFLNESSFE